LDASFSSRLDLHGVEKGSSVRESKSTKKGLINGGTRDLTGVEEFNRSLTIESGERFVWNHQLLLVGDPGSV
jgi:hypothetical protein